MKVKIKKLVCAKCKKEWMPRTEDVRQCPRCKTAYWEKDRRSKNAL
jgi:Zn finger protein HypA/HybF involved in hydrogenase expression